MEVFGKESPRAEIRRLMRKHDVSWRRGFLGVYDPLIRGPGTLKEHMELGCDLPEYSENTADFEKRVHALPTLSDEALVQLRALPRSLLTRAAVSLSFIAQRWVMGDWRNPKNTLPQEIARPIWAVCSQLGTAPLLVYQYYTLANWQCVDSKKLITAENVAMLQHFNSRAFPDRFRSEEWFIAIHIEIEKTAGPLIEAALVVDHALHIRAYDLLKLNLPIITQQLTQMTATLARMSEHCTPETYYEYVRPYLFGWSVVPGGVRYEGIPDTKFDAPTYFRGQTGAQSSIAPLLDIVLDIEHNEKDPLSEHLKVMLEGHTPQLHREFLLHLKRRERRNEIRWSRACLHPEVREEYRKVRLALASFRREHYRQAVINIARFAKREKAGVALPKGTGGTDFVASLKRHIQDTLHVEDAYRFHFWESEWKALYRASN